MHFYSESQAPLFNKHDLRDRLEQDCAAAEKAADELPRERFATESDQRLAQAIVAEHVLAPLGLDITGYTVEDREIALDERQGGTTIVLDVHIPFHGRPGLLHCQPSRPPRQFVYGEASESSVVLTFLQGQPEQLKHEIESRAALLKDWGEAVNADIMAMTSYAEQQVLERLRRRRTRFDQSRALLAALDIPVKKLQPNESLEMPVIARRVTPEKGPPTRPDREEWRLSNTIYQQVVTTITRFSHALERRPSSARTLVPDEETLRDWLIFMLNSSYETDSEDEVFTAGEALNGNGKTDILVHHCGRNVFIGECKFWNGPKAFLAAIDQLLSYLVWRDTKAALVLFITQRDATKVIHKADRCIQEHRQFVVATPPAEPNRRRDYTLTSPHDSDRTISLALIPVVIGFGGGSTRSKAAEGPLLSW